MRALRASRPISNPALCARLQRRRARRDVRHAVVTALIISPAGVSLAGPLRSMPPRRRATEHPRAKSLAWTSEALAPEMSFGRLKGRLTKGRYSQFTSPRDFAGMHAGRGGMRPIFSTGSPHGGGAKTRDAIDAAIEKMVGTRRAPRPPSAIGGVRTRKLHLGEPRGVSRLPGDGNSVHAGETVSRTWKAAQVRYLKDGRDLKHRRYRDRRGWFGDSSECMSRGPPAHAAKLIQVTMTRDEGDRGGANRARPFGISATRIQTM